MKISKKEYINLLEFKILFLSSIETTETPEITKDIEQIKSKIETLNNI